MLTNTSLAAFTVLVNALDRPTEFGLELFRSECNQIRDVYYPGCPVGSLGGSLITVYSNHIKKEGRIDQYLERLWINHFLCQMKGCLYNHEGVTFSARGSFDLLLDPAPKISRTLLPLFPYRTVKYSIYVRQPETRVRLFAFYYIFSPTLWIVMLGSLGLVTLVTLLIRSASSSFSPVPEVLQSLFNLFANNGSTDGFYGSCSIRIVFIVGSTLVMIFWISFSTFLIAELAVSPPHHLHGDVGQLLKGRKLKAVCVESKSAVHARLLNTVRPLVNTKPCPAGWPQWIKLLNQVCKSKESKVGFAESSSFLEEYYFFRKTLPPPPCKLSPIMDNVFQVPKAIITRRGYPYREEIGHVFLKLSERGISQLVTKRVFETIRPPQSEKIIQDGYLKISLRRLTITFALLAIGAGLAGVIFILEWVAYFRRQALSYYRNKFDD